MIVPIAYISQKNAEKRAATQAEAELAEAVKKAEARADELERKTKSRRLTFASMSGAYLSGVSYSSAQGNLWFTNASPRSGVVCLVAHADEGAGKTSDSIPACQEVGAYSGVKVSFMFAGGDLSSACPKSNCRLSFTEAPEPKEEKTP